MLGLASVLACGGLITGLPAVFLGLSAKRHADAFPPSRASGFATTGIVTGLIGTFATFVWATLLITTYAWSKAHPPAPATVTLGTPSVTVTPSDTKPGPVSRGAITLVDMDPDDGPLRSQLGAFAHRAKAEHKVVLVQTTAKWCRPCRDFETSLTDERMQNALRGIMLVRVDVDDFEATELRAHRMDMDTVPWFFKLDSRLRANDAISSGEWDEDVAENIAPVMRAFLDGKLSKRRHPALFGLPL